MEIPTLVPTLSQQEKQYLLSTPEDKVFEVNPKLMKQIQNKAVDFAKQRIAQ